MAHCNNCSRAIYYAPTHHSFNPRVHCMCKTAPSEPAPVNHCTAKPKWATLLSTMTLRCFSGDATAVQIIGDDNEPCWYRILEIADGATAPAEDGDEIIYDCLSRVWEKQYAPATDFGLDARVTVNEADIAALEAAVAALPTPITDTFSTAEAATVAGTDSFGNAIAIGDPVLTLPNGDTVNLQHTLDTNTDTDTFGIASFATLAGTDVYGNAYNPGASIVTFPNGAVVALDAGTNTFGVPSVATVDGTDFFGNDYVIGDGIVTFPGGNVVCVPNPVVDIDCDNGTWIDTYKDGTTRERWTDGGFYPLGILPANANVTAATPVGTVIQSGTRNLPVSKNGRFVVFDAFVEYNRALNFQGDAVIQLQFTIDGGLNWTPFTTNGERRISHMNNAGAPNTPPSPSVREGEYPLIAKAQSNVPEGNNTVGLRAILTENGITSGEISFGTSNMSSTYSYGVCI